ncbi:hypothetical protein ISF_09823 [Cordyceps fumosorosea ARSEF 2679]|uniref:Uncharacterized protein n=1 Tax=Cordyceps fumosorosea (strain ARSEF 2679) TaxID=1081104 RepID=A0A167BI11_CORFA|nr:hypothetical protein ISF_09823 [Cordyceps fumosorosea ARSEF 2679]OAA40069.1 hypothetical protein ISF_09823 [Cordyceps fumosorosea ARSEF 2679]
MPPGEAAAHGACEHCRQKKRKVCYEKAVDCVYAPPPRVSKADLREELARLQKATSDDNALLDTISSKETSLAQLDTILRRLSDGQPRAQVASLISHMPPAAASCVQPDTTTTNTTPPSSVTTAGSPSVLMDPMSSAGPASTSPSSSLATTSDESAASKTAEFRAHLGYYRAQLPRLLSTILARDCLSFCPINERELKRDVAAAGAGAGAAHGGGGGSTALADALLALGALLAKDHPRLATALLLATPQPGNLLGDADSLGQAFAHEALFALHNNGTGRPRRLADIQALGVLALYWLSCDRLKQSREFAGDYCAAMAEAWCADGAGTLVDSKARASIYCAAVSLNRVLFLLADFDETLNAYARSAGMGNAHAAAGASETPVVPCQLDLAKTIIDDAFFRRDLRSIPDNPRVIAAKLFELAEWTYEARSGPQKATFDHAVQVYNQGLRWYETFFRYTRGCGKSNTSMILFVQ